MQSETITTEEELDAQEMHDLCKELRRAIKKAAEASK